MLDQTLSRRYKPLQPTVMEPLLISSSSFEIASVGYKLIYLTSNILQNNMLYKQKKTINSRAFGSNLIMTQMSRSLLLFLNHRRYTNTQYILIIFRSQNWEVVPSRDTAQKQSLEQISTLHFHTMQLENKTPTLQEL